MDQPDLPADVALLWGRRPAPRRGRNPALSVDGITRAAITVADAEGLGAVSMARVAAELGSAAMSLYRYVDSKDELLLLMSDAALDEPPAALPGADWRERLTAWAHSVLGMMRQHPWYREVPLKGPPAGPRNLAWFDRALGALADVPVSEEDKVVVVTGLLPIVHGQARLAIDLAAGYAEDPDAFGAGYAASLATLVDPVGFPALSRAVAAGVFGPGGPGGADAPDEPYDDFGPEFAFALACYFDGVAAFLASRTGG
ncbi:TetR/AcrR family transcriptional regulator [Blastococcus sp. URHD0036]|uniref:TetR/AcrR family transcriptional regulator n=1 Tax=Blastococcus sp. URHD0036 TaxID=1380356 RepID=UPI0004961EC8|nr:TetR/AcrR family transcriptional regulator C-terminal domain-containing protein [Blastococcus sp. URHD0036]